MKREDGRRKKNSINFFLLFYLLWFCLFIKMPSASKGQIGIFRHINNKCVHGTVFFSTIIYRVEWWAFLPLKYEI